MSAGPARDTPALPDDAGERRVTVPTPRPGINEFLTGDWWAGRAGQLSALRARLVPADDATELLLPMGSPADPAEPSTVVVVSTPVRSRLHGTLSDRLGQVEAWERDLLAWADRAPVVLLVAEAPPETMADLCLAAAGRRYPRVDVDAAASAGAPEVEETRLAREYRMALVERIGETVPPAWLTRRFAADDAARAVSYATDVDPDLTPTEAAQLRERTVSALDRLRAAGVRIRGSREALRWPVASTEGRLAPEVAASAAVELLHGVVERCDDLTLLEPRRRRTPRPKTPRPEELSTRSLLKLLVGRHA